MLKNSTLDVEIFYNLIKISPFAASISENLTPMDSKASNKFMEPEL